MTAAALPDPTRSPAAARQAAASILHERRFRPPSFPRPLHRPLAAIGDALRHAADGILHAVQALGAHVPGGTVTVWLALAALVFAVSVRLARMLSRRALLAAERRPSGEDAPPRPEALEREAERAEREGRLGEAVRLRFRAGLMRLARGGAIASASSLPSAAVSRSLRSAEFDRLAGRFDEIVYGGDAATSGDVEEARRRWPQVLRQRETGRS